MIAVSASFVAEPLGVPLTWLLGEVGLQDEIRFAPYHQVFQQLLTASSEFAQSDGINVALVRIEDYIRDLPGRDAAIATISRVASDLGDALEGFSGRSTGSLVLLLFAPSPGVSPELYEPLLEANLDLTKRVRNLRGLYFLDGTQTLLANGKEGYDVAQDQLAHIPYTDARFAAIALVTARCIHAMKVPAAKVLVLDCDNTLWRGVVGEDGVQGIEIIGGHAVLQDFAIEQQAKGVLVCLASKNSEADVLDVLERRSDMRLRANHVVAHRINWEPKPANLRSLASELNLGLDAFVFLDDNPLECAQMRAELPQVVTLELPSDAEIPQFLRHLWCFDKLTTTSEDANRTRMYRENAARSAAESATHDIGAFLAALDLMVDIAVPVEADWSRIEQLTQRTNQFNFTTRRRTASELKVLGEKGAFVLRVRVSDRFGDYGLVGVIIAEDTGSEVLVDTLLLSCRVLGRGVEHAMLRKLGAIAEGLGRDTVALPYIPTARNVPARAFADSVLTACAVRGPDAIVYRVPLAQVLQISHRPGHDPVEVTDARTAEERKVVDASSVSALNPPRATCSERYSRLARVLVSGEAVVDQMSTRARRHRQNGGEVLVPNTVTEAQLLRLWEDVLQIDGIGVEDDYFDLGGTSLLSVKLFAEIERRFGVQLRLTAILNAPNVRSLARLLAPNSQERTNLVCLRRGGTDNLFLVHDGLGETLLYRNLARRLPATLSIFGIEPRRMPGIPLAHASIEDMAAYYVERVRGLQPHGPYLLGGMCAGGVIAYEMAACLRRAGEPVQLVTILDGATPQAAKRLGRVTSHRLSRVRDVLARTRGASDSVLVHWFSVAVGVARKALNVAAYELSSVALGVSTRVRFALMRVLVARGYAWPSGVPGLSVMQIYNMLEARYRPPTLTDVRTLLVRASAGEGSDTPYSEIYEDDHLGWAKVAMQLEVVDVSGGHSSMLQEQSIESLASTLVSRLSTAEFP